MEGLLLFLFWAVVIGLSIASKVQERRKQQELQQRKQSREPRPVDDAQRRRVYGGVEPRTAAPRSSEGAGRAPQTTSQESTRSAKPVEQQVLERFFGVDMDDDSERGVPPQVAERTRDVVDRLRGRPPEPAQPKPPPVPSYQEEELDREREWRLRTEKAKRAKEAARRRAAAAKRSREAGTSESRSPIGRLLSTNASLRDAIVLNAILNPPKAFEDDRAKLI